MPDYNNSYRDNRTPYPANGRQNGGYPNRNNERTTESADAVFSRLSYNPYWITDGANEEMVQYAEEAGKYMANKGLTNSKIRSIYGEIKRIQMGEFDKVKSSFYLLKPKVAYALGRDKTNEGLRLFKLIFDKCSSNVIDQKTFHNFCNFIEAILAYHKANGGKD